MKKPLLGCFSETPSSTAASLSQQSTADFMRYLSVVEILDLHRRVIEQPGGSTGGSLGPKRVALLVPVW